MLSYRMTQGPISPLPQKKCFHRKTPLFPYSILHLSQSACFFFAWPWSCSIPRSCLVFQLLVTSMCGIFACHQYVRLSPSVHCPLTNSVIQMCKNSSPQLCAWPKRE